MPKIDRIGYTHVQQVDPSPGAPERGKGFLLRLRLHALRNSPLKTTQRSSVLADVIGVLEGRKGEYDLR